MKKKVSVSWSGGKDSAFALYKILQARQMEVVSLHTSFNEELKRVGMHGTPETLIEAQAFAVGIPLEKIYIPADSSNKSYENSMLRFYSRLKERGVEAVVFGDIFLEDLKEYREQLLAKAGLEGKFPLWQQNTRQLIGEFLQEGFNTAICAAGAQYFEKETAGIVIDEEFVKGLPEHVDPCGERGEFHTFVFEAPFYKEPVPYCTGATIYKDYSLGSNSAGDTEKRTGFWFADLRPCP